MYTTDLLAEVKVFLLKHGCRMGARARQDYIYRLRHFTRWAPQETLAVETLEAYRNAAIRKGYSPATIEAVIAAVRFVAAYGGHEISLGRSLVIPKPDPDVPSMARVVELYNAVHCAEWPTRMGGAKRSNWWRGFIFLACWTGLRLGDLRELSWESIKADSIHVRASKTKRHGRAALRIPVTPPVRRHLEMLRCLRQPTVLGLTQCYKQLRRELSRIALRAGVAAVQPHGFRRYAITQWSNADATAGRIIQGCGLGVMRHYLDVEQYLAKVAPSVEIPQAFLSPREQLQVERGESHFLARYRRASPVDRRLIEQMLDRLG